MNLLQADTTVARGGEVCEVLRVGEAVILWFRQQMNDRLQRKTHDPAFVGARGDLLIRRLWVAFGGPASVDLGAVLRVKVAILPFQSCSRELERSQGIVDLNLFKPIAIWDVNRQLFRNSRRWDLRFKAPVPERGSQLFCGSSVLVAIPLWILEGYALRVFDEDLLMTMRLVWSSVRERLTS